MFEVYKHTAPNGKAYVGLTSIGTTPRWARHVKASRAGSPLPFHRAIRKHGADAFAHEVLERMTTEAGAKRAEQLWIRELGTFGHGYNATAGGEGTVGAPPWNKGRKASAEECRKNSEAQRGRKQSKETLAKRFSPEARAKMAIAQIGKSHSPETRARMAAAQREAHARDKTRGVKLSEFRCQHLAARKAG